MLDGTAKTVLDPWLNAAGQRLASRGVRANHVTLAGFAIGVGAAAAIVSDMLWSGLVLILLSRLCDGLDGAVARASGVSDFGGYLDIVLDFAFYGIIPLAFVIAEPEANAIAGALLIFSFYVNGASFLAYATIAEKRDLTTDARGVKSLYFTTGLAEASETLAVFVLCCLFPQWFSAIAIVFAILCFYTAFSRIVLASRQFSD